MFLHTESVVSTKLISSVEKGNMSSVETGQMSSAETGHMSSLKTGQMSASETGQNSAVPEWSGFACACSDIRYSSTHRGLLGGGVRGGGSVHYGDRALPQHPLLFRYFLGV